MSCPKSDRLPPQEVIRAAYRDPLTPRELDPSAGWPARSADPDAPLFAYGSLRFPEVLEVLLGRVPSTKPAEAEGWRVIPLPGLVYPRPGARARDRHRPDH